MQIPPPRTTDLTVSSEHQAELTELLHLALKNSSLPDRAIGRILKNRPDIVQQVLLTGLERMAAMEDPQFAFDHDMAEASAETGAC